jgi:hypothetical protein
MISCFHAMSVPQLFSHDYYFRLAERKLGTAVLTHSFSEEAPGVLQDLRSLCLPARRAGITEWEGLEEGHPLSLGWDWMELADGDIRPVMIVAPRTNIMVIDRQGYDIAEPSSAAFLWELIARLPWQRCVTQALHDGALVGAKVA